MCAGPSYKWLVGGDMAAQTVFSFRTYEQLARQHGPVFKASFRTQPVCVVAGAAEIRLVPPCLACCSLTPYEQ